MSRTYPLMAAALAIALAPACSDLVSPGRTDTYELPAPDGSLDPARLAVGDLIATPCAFGTRGDGLAHLRARDEWALVDIYFGRGSAEGAWDAAAPADRALVKAHGGRVLHEFNVPAVRARIVLSRIPDLVQAGFWILVREVPDATRYDVPLTMGFVRSLGDADIERFATLGGQVTYRFDVIDALAGVLPDRSIPALRQWTGVEYVQPETVYCPQ